MKERLESARNWHRLGFAVSATALVLLFAPFKTDYRQALNEAYVLRDLRLDEYQRWARGFLGQNTLLPQLPNIGWGLWEREITEFLSSKLDFQVQGSPDWDVTATVEYEHAPTNGTLADWSAWMSSSKQASYYHPDWSTARLSASRDGVGITKPPIVRHFLLRASTWRRFDGEYSFRGYVELDESSPRQARIAPTAAAVEEWWRSLDQLDSRELFEKHSQLGLDENKFVVEGDVGSQLRVIDAKCGIRQWLESSGVWSKITTNDGAGEIVLQGMRRNWSDVRDRSLSDAIGFMEAKQREIQDVSLLGLPVPGQLCVVAIPLAYLVFHLFLLLDVRSVRRDLSPGGATEPPVAWPAIYDDVIALWVTVLSLILIPAVLSAALLLKYYSRVPASSAVIAILAGAAALVVGILTYRSIAVVRRRFAVGREGMPA